MPPQERDPGHLRRVLERIRRLRNRIMHHEPVWNRPYLMNNRQEACQVIRWIDPSVAALVDKVDRSPEIHAAGVASCFPPVDAIFP